MLIGLRNVVGGNAALPFVRLFYGRPSQYLWEDDLETVVVLGGTTPGPGSSTEAAPAGRESLRASGRPTW